MKKQLLKTILTTLLIIISLTDRAQTWQWAKSGDGPSANEGYAMTIDPSNNVIITGMSLGLTQTFGTYTLTKAGSQDFYLVKYDASGNVIWAKGSTCTGADGGMSVSSDASGNIYMAGEYFGATMVLGTYTLANAGGNDIFITKLDNNGNVLWATSAGNANNDLVSSIRTDAAGNSYVCGYFQSPTIAFGTYTLTNPGNYSIYIVKYDANGNVLWAKNASDCSNNVVSAVTIAPGGNIYLTGVFTSPTITFGTYTLTNSGSSDLFITKYNTSGVVQWAKNSNGTSDEVSRAICSDTYGNVYVTGNYTGPAFSFGTSVFNNAGQSDAFVLKVDPNGNGVWGKNIGGTTIDAGYAINTYSNGVFAVGGYYSPTIVIGTNTLSNSSLDAMYIAHYDLNGNNITATSLISGGDDNIDICFDNSCNGYITGDFGGNMAVGTTTLLITGVENIFTAKFSFNCVVDLGINETAMDPSSVVFPNPTNGKISIQAPSVKENSDIEIYNALGKKIFHSQLRTNNSEIDLSEFPSGIYILRIGGLTKKIIKE